MYVFVFLGILLTGGVDPDQEMIDLRMNAVKHKILILSGKGGEIVIEIIWYNY